MAQWHFGTCDLHGEDTRGTIFRHNNVFEIGGETILEKESYQYQEDAIVLCLSYELSKDVADKLKDRAACVEILDLSKLLYCISHQLGNDAQIGICKYTTTMERGHFIKSIHDSWQREFRAIWRYNPEYRSEIEKHKFQIPAGIAKQVYWNK